MTSKVQQKGILVQTISCHYILTYCCAVCYLQVISTDTFYYFYC